MTTISMSEPTQLQHSTTEPERIVGRITGTRPGPTVIVTVAIHGNEPAGMIAARRILASLAGREADLRGDLIVILGNLAAFREQTRFIHDDLNRP